MHLCRCIKKLAPAALTFFEQEGQIIVRKFLYRLVSLEVCDGSWVNEGTRDIGVGGKALPLIGSVGDFESDTSGGWERGEGVGAFGKEG